MFLQQPLVMPHAKSMLLCSRLVKFKEQRCTSNKPVVSLLALLSMEDRRTTLGRNMARIQREIGGVQPSCCNIRKHMKFFATPIEELWRIPLLEELVEVTNKKMYIENFSDEETKLMMNTIYKTKSTRVGFSPGPSQCSPTSTPLPLSNLHESVPCLCMI